MSSSEEEYTYLPPGELSSKLGRCTNLPSPPAVAVQILALGEDPEAGLGQLADVISQDPAIASRLLRVANSPIYARRRQSENLRQAVTLLGLDGTMTLALSFSLVNGAIAEGVGSMDYDLYWRRSLMSAASARALGMHLGRRDIESLFLAALLQDIGMLALGKLMPDIYAGLEDPSDHQRIRDIETDAVGVDHAATGAWLLARWRVPGSIVDAVFDSHATEGVAAKHADPQFAGCVAASGCMADIWLREDHAHATVEVKALVEGWLGIPDTDFIELLKSVAGQIASTEHLFDTKLVSASANEAIMDEARELLVIRNLQAMQTANSLKRRTDALETRTRELEEQSRRDGLTDLFNRGHLDRILIDEFQRSKDQQWPLSIAFIDLDHFKRVNDELGHQAGDEVLRGAGRLLLQITRSSDLVARYGGEEFVVLYPGVGISAAKRSAERLVDAFRETSHRLSSGDAINVTVSIGIAVQGEGYDFESVEDFVKAADGAVYRAKNEGRNRIKFHESTGLSETDGSLKLVGSA